MPLPSFRWARVVQNPASDHSLMGSSEVPILSQINLKISSKAGNLLQALDKLLIVQNSLSSTLSGLITLKLFNL